MNPTISADTLASINAQIAKINQATTSLGAQNNTTLTRLPSLGNPPPTPGSGVVSGSGSVVAGENQTKTAVSNLNLSMQSPDATAATTASEARIQSLNNYQSQLEQRRQNEISSINAGFDTAKTQTGKAQEKEVGSTSAGLARTGGYLGGSGSGTGVMLSLAISHRDELTAIEGKRQAAIQLANNAIDDKQFALAQEKVKEAKDLEQTIYSRNKDFWDQQLQLQQENRAQDKFLQDKYKDELSVISTTGIATPQKAAELDRFYGVPGFTAKYLEITNADKVAKSEKAKFDSFKSKMDLLQSIPQGMKVQFGDETITGIGKTSDIDVYHVQDANGNVTQVTYNKGNGSISTQGLGAIGTPSASSSASLTSQKISSMTDELIKLAGSDGYVSPTSYKNGLKVWLRAEGTLKTYEDNFKIFANPNDVKSYDFSSYYNKSADEILTAFIGGR